MKIAAVATLLALPLSQAYSLFPKHKFSKAQIVVHGVLHDFSHEDLAIINESAITAYNNAQKGSGYSLKEIKPLLHFGVSGKNLKQGCQLCPPDDDSFAFGTANALVVDLEIAEWKFPGLNQGCQLCPPDDDMLNQGCQLCPPDDDAIALEKTASANYKAFEKNFCTLLAASGSANLINAHHCSFSFLEEPGHKVAPLQLKTVAGNDESALGFLSVSGLLQDLSARDMSVIEKVVFETYNQVYRKTGYSVESIASREAVAAPATALKQGCQLCPPDDDSLTMTGNVILFDMKFGGGLKQGCQLCPPDDDAVVVGHSGPELEMARERFSKVLCARLRETGSANLAFAEDCTFNFFYQHNHNNGKNQA